jgi:hypothetical protein
VPLAHTGLRRHHVAMAVAMRDPALDFVLASDEPAIRHAGLTELLDRPQDDPEVRSAREAIPDGPIVRGLLAARGQDGRWLVHPYAKWGGAHWRLVSLADLAVPPSRLGLDAAYDSVLEWLGPGHVKRVRVIEGLARRCGSQEGNALNVGVWLDRADESRVRQLAEHLIRWQWPDGGWNCDIRPGARHSSFNETLPPLIGLSRFAVATGDAAARDAADRAAEFLLRHRVVFSERTGTIAHPVIVELHYPPYWHYDVLAALRALAVSRHIDDPRTADALDLLEAQRRSDGTWRAGGRWWRRPGSTGSNVEVVDWGGRGPNAALTLSALRVLRAAGRWSATG